MKLAWSQNWSAAKALAKALLLIGVSSSFINEGRSTITSIICHYIIVDEDGEIHPLTTTGVKPTFSEDKSEPMSSEESRERILELYKDVNGCDPPDPLTENEGFARQSNPGEADYSDPLTEDGGQADRGSVNDASATTRAAHILANISVDHHNGNFDSSALPSQHIEGSSNPDKSGYIHTHPESGDTEPIIANSEEVGPGIDYSSTRISSNRGLVDT
jgi:hypothetical protein